MTQHYPTCKYRIKNGLLETKHFNSPMGTKGWFDDKFQAKKAEEEAEEEAEEKAKKANK